MTNIAEKTKPALWKKIVARVKKASKGGAAGTWSARKAQLAVSEYKKAGGGYKGKKTKKNDLVKWTQEDWDYVDAKDKEKPRSKRGRYLPKKVRKTLTAKEKKATNKKKKAATKRGAKKAKYSKKIAKKVRKA
jgi:hypothetical protein